MVADPEAEAAEVMESQEESLEADQGQPVGAVRFTETFPPPATNASEEGATE